MRDFSTGSTEILPWIDPGLKSSNWGNCSESINISEKFTEKQADSEKIV